jgi:peptide/nickel transport system substrate-binding protein
VRLFFALAAFFAAFRADAAVKNPDTLVILTGVTARTLDPAMAYGGTDLFVNYNVYETLVENPGGDLDRIGPLLSENVPDGGGDGRSYRFRIRRGVRFHEGGELTPEDVRYSLLRFMLADWPGGPSGLLREAVVGDDRSFRAAARAVRVDGDAVVVRLARPFPAFLSIVARWGLIVDREWAIENGDWDGTSRDLERMRAAGAEALAFHRRANGTGPFRLERWELKSDEIVLARSGIYWGKPAKLRRARIRTLDDFNAKKMMLANGDADSIFADYTQVSRVRGLEGVRVTERLPVLGLNALMFNVSVNTRESRFAGSGRLDGSGVPADFFKERDVREAFASLVDYEGLIRDAFLGNAERATGFIPRGMSGYAERLPPYAFDPAKAERLLRRARGGRIWEQGFKIILPYPSWDEVSGVVARQLAGALRALNPKFSIEVRSLPYTAVADASAKRTLPLMFGGWRADYADPHNMARPLLHRDGFYGRKLGFGGAETDRLIERARDERDREKRLSLYARLRERWIEELPWAALFTQQWIRVEREWVRGFVHNPIYPGAPSYSPLAPMFKKE